MLALLSWRGEAESRDCAQSRQGDDVCMLQATQPRNANDGEAGHSRCADARPEMPQQHKMAPRCPAVLPIPTAAGHRLTNLARDEQRWQSLQLCRIPSERSEGSRTQLIIRCGLY